MYKSTDNKDYASAYFDMLNELKDNSDNSDISDSPYVGHDKVKRDVMVKIKHLDGTWDSDKQIYKDQKNADVLWTAHKIQDIHPLIRALVDSGLRELQLKDGRVWLKFNDKIFKKEEDSKDKEEPKKEEPKKEEPKKEEDSKDKEESKIEGPKSLDDFDKALSEL